MTSAGPRRVAALRWPTAARPLAAATLGPSASARIAIRSVAAEELLSATASLLPGTEAAAGPATGLTDREFGNRPGRWRLPFGTR
jgi:hypothetical protein